MPHLKTRSSAILGHDANNVENIDKYGNGVDNDNVSEEEHDRPTSSPGLMPYLAIIML